MSRARRLLILGGLALAIWGMGYGFWYAVWVEHQTLDAIGSNLAAAFVHAAERNPAQSQRALDAYAATAFGYVRQVDVHSHWIGLAILMVVLGIGLDRVRFDKRRQFAIALTLLIGSAIFPLGVLLQTTMHGAVPQAIAIIGVTMVTIALASITVGFFRLTPEA